MAKQSNPLIGKEIRNLLLVIFSGIAVAVIAASYMLYYYNPSGRYFAKNVLLSPQNLSAFTFNDTNPKTGRLNKYAFAGIDFSYFDKRVKIGRKVSVDKTVYTQFYNRVANEKSLSDLSDDVIAQFNRLNPATLTLKVHPENNPESTNVFLETNFVNEGDYYRVQLRDTSGATGTWAYFYHPGIYREVLQLFAKSS